MDKEIIQKIQVELGRIEKEHKVAIFYACEAGSRAWGFASEDSDYDVRFLYLHPMEWYLSAAKKRDVIEKKIAEKLDVSGWDLPKCLNLLKKSNPPFLEWIQSPIVYKENRVITDLIREVIPEYYSPRSCLLPAHGAGELPGVFEG